MGVLGTIERELDDILSEPRSSVVERERNTLDQLLAASNHRVVLFGAGNLGRQTLTCLRGIGVDPLAFSDNNAKIWNTSIENVPVFSPSEAAERFGRDALFLVTIWSPNHWYTETLRQLSMLGCERVAPISAVHWRFEDHFLPFYALDTPSNLHRYADEIAEASTIWADDASAKEYIRQIKWRFVGEWEFTRDPEESYFPDSIFQLTPGELFLDCGAFDGDTVRAVLRREPSFGRIHAVESEEVTFQRLSAFLDSLPQNLRARIKAHSCAVGPARGIARFPDSRGGETVVRQEALPGLLDLDERVTYIKMDIEGAELDGLKGGRDVIQRDGPVLAICVYHQPEHFWQVPLLIKDMLPEHKMYLRCYEGDGWQTVAYAVPTERLRELD